MRFYSALTTSALLVTVLTSVMSPAFAARHHHSAAAGHEAKKEAQAQAAHRIRLAAKEKKAWREHLAKLHSLPHAERVAEKRHEKKWQRKHDEKVAATQAAAKHEKRAALREAKLARRHHHAAALVAAAPKPRKATQAHKLLAAKRSLLHTKHLAALGAAHRANVQRMAQIGAAKNFKHRQNVARQAQIAHEWAARRQAVHTLHLQKIAAAHRQRWTALHGDNSGGKSIRFWQTGAAGVPVKVISVDLNDPNVKVSAVMAARGNGTSEPFRQMINRANPNVAVTGTFFSLDDLQPVGDIVVDGNLVHFGGMGTALCITPANRATMVTCQWGRHHDWSPFDFVVACGPRLLHSGRVALDPRAERFHDRHMLAPNSRIAVGITRGNTLFFVMTHEPIYLGRLARVMQSLGASDAMNLDAGTSTGFYYNGATLARPGRKLTNMIVVYGRRERYEHALDQLVSPMYHRAASRHFPSNTRTAALVRP